MPLKEYHSYYYSYYQILNKAIIRNKSFHFFFKILDSVILILKILSIYQSNYNQNIEKSNKILFPYRFLSNYLIIFKLLPIILYLIIGYIISILYSFSSFKKKVNKIDIIIVNFFEFFIIRLFFVFFIEFLLSLNSLYFLLFLALSLPFFAFILMNITFFHLTTFMLKIINFPFDDFTSLIDKQIIYIKILIAISGSSISIDICKLMFFTQFVLIIFFLIYDTYVIFHKSYYLMNNELISKIIYSNILCISIIQIFMFLMKPEEIFGKLFILIILCIFIFVTLLFFLFYNPYNYIIIDASDNKENLYYYFFLIDRNKNIAFFLEDKIKKHISKCNCCSLCFYYQENINNNIIEFENEENKDKDLFYILYSGKDKSMLLFNDLIHNIKKFGINCLTSNSYYFINLIYIFYYFSSHGENSFSLNLLLIFNFILENNHLLIYSHKISIKQISYIDEFFNIVKKILVEIKEIISKSNIKKNIEKFFNLSKSLTALNNSKFRDNLYGTKEEGVINCMYLISICSLLYEEIFNKALSNYSIPIRENTQLHEDIFKNFIRQNNNITLNFNLKTIECKIIYAAKELFECVGNNFYDLFPNQLKEVLIQNFCDNILNFKEMNLKNNRNNKLIKKRYIEQSLLIKNTIDNINYYRSLNLRLILLFNDHMKENILLNGVFYINQNILVTINNNNSTKEKIFGYGNKDIMEVIYKNKLNFSKFKESTFMKNKIIKNSYSFSVNNNIFNIYNISEIKKKRKTEKKEIISKNSTKIKDDITFKDDNITNNNYSKEEDDFEDSNSNTQNGKKLNNILEENISQSSLNTKNSGNSFWNFNKGTERDEQNSFSSKAFLNLQILLGGMFVFLLILMLLLLLQLKSLQFTISDYSYKYFNLIEFIRGFHLFSYTFVSLTCIVRFDNGTCDEYISVLDNEEFNQSLFLMEQNEILSETCSENVRNLILTSETINDKHLMKLFKDYISYYLINIKKDNGYYDITLSEIDVNFNDALLLLSNNMRIIASMERRLKSESKEIIYLIYSLDNPFENIKDKSTGLSDYQISVYTYLINFKSYVQRFSNLSLRLNELINEKNEKLVNIVNIFHNIILLVMIIHIIIILFYLLTFNKIIAKIINSIIIKFDIILDDENDFIKLFNIKINQLEYIVKVYSNNPIDCMKEINKNCSKYRNLINAKKKNEQRLNMNKKTVKENEEEKHLFRDNKKYISWIDIYKNGYDRFYIIFTIIVSLIDITVYFIILGIWIDYKNKSESTLDLINYSWNFERNTLRLVNFYHTMLFTNQTIDDLTNNYYSDNVYNCIENFHQILYSYYELRKKRKNIANIYRNYDYFSEYNCKSLYNSISSLEATNSFSKTMKIMKEKYNKDIEKLKNSFINECEETKSFIGNSVSPAFQSLYQKVTDAMILLNDRTYNGIVEKIFNSTLPRISSQFLNVQRYIVYISGKITYINATNKIIEILGNYIIISLILYILSECVHFIFFFFIYIWNINIECKNMFKLKRVFEITNPIEI